jgi:hypothetical protein
MVELRKTVVCGPAAAPLKNRKVAARAMILCWSLPLSAFLGEDKVLKLILMLSFLDPSLMGRLPSASPESS